MKVIPLQERNIKLWKGQDEGRNINEKDISLLESELLAQKEDEKKGKEEDKKKDEEEDEEGDKEEDKEENYKEDKEEDEEENKEEDEKEDEKKNKEGEENEEKDQDKDKKGDKKKNKKGEKKESSSDDERKYVFFEDKNLSKNPPPLCLHNTHNYAIFLNIKKNCFSPTFIMQAIQKLILKFMYFLLIYKLDTHIATSSIYFFPVINSIYLKNVYQI